MTAVLLLLIFNFLPHINVAKDSDKLNIRPLCLSCTVIQWVLSTLHLTFLLNEALYNYEMKPCYHRK